MNGDAAPPDPAPAEPATGETTPAAPPPSPVREEPSGPRGAYQAASRPSPAGYVVVGGLVLLALGFAWLRVEEETTWVTGVWIGAALLCVFGPLAWHGVDWWNDATKVGAGRRLGALASVTLTILLGLVVFGVASALNIKFKDRLPSLDLTAAGKYTLSEETRRRLDAVKGTVYATYIEYDNERTDYDLRTQAQVQLDVYPRHTSRVVVRRFNGRSEPDALLAYLNSVGVESLTSGERDDLIVFTYAEPGREVARGKQKELRVESFSFTKLSATTGDPAWLGERAITAAIQELVFERYKVYATGGHGEMSLAQDGRRLRERLAGQNLDVVAEPLDLARAGRVPADCNLLLVLGPKTAFTAEEQQAIQDHLDRGRGAFICLDIDKTGSLTDGVTGLEDVLVKFGVRPHVNFVVMAPKASRVEDTQGAIISMTAGFFIPREAYADHPATRALREGAGFSALFVEAGYLEVDSEPQPGVEADPVVWAPDLSAEQFVQPVRAHAAKITPGRRNFSSPAEGDKSGVRLPLAVCATRQVSAARGVSDGAPKDARLCVVADADIFADDVVSQYPVNADLFNGLAQWSLRREELTAVGEKTLENLSVTISSRQHRMAKWWPMVVTLLALFAGAGVWWSRRR